MDFLRFGPRGHLDTPIGLCPPCPPGGQADIFRMSCRVLRAVSHKTRDIFGMFAMSSVLAGGGHLGMSSRRSKCPPIGNVPRTPDSARARAKERLAITPGARASRAHLAGL